MGFGVVDTLTFAFGPLIRMGIDHFNCKFWLILISWGMIFFFILQHLGVRLEAATLSYPFSV
jgi:hypothetical protein